MNRSPEDGKNCVIKATQLGSLEGKKKPEEDYSTAGFL